MSTELDPRLVGKSASDITKEFVEANITEEELATPIYQESEQLSTLNTIISTSKPSVTKTGLHKILRDLQKIPSNCKDYRFTLRRVSNNYEVILSHKVTVNNDMKPEKKIRHFVKLWKKMIEDFETREERLALYLELKEEFGDYEEEVVEEEETPEEVIEEGVKVNNKDK